MTDKNTLRATERSTTQRRPRLAHHERELIYQILDEALVCHVGFVVDNQPFVIPMGYGRDGDRLYIHGSPASRMLQALQTGIEICVTITLLDGLVIARSLFHHEMNYRSVVLFGQAILVERDDEKLTALRVLSDQIIPQRWEQARPPNAQEIKGTTVLLFPIEEGSAKVGSGAPHDNAEDYALSVWAGEVPLMLKAGVPIPDPKLSPTIAPPENLVNYRRGR